ncbi:protein COP1 SUPPRESSOR 2 [Cyclospora cayetanensis]|uniref:Protein COP1 SUPPRESSOR 2 n=1 Tax=Cyclospora cayetanensis TaxID=88456 RepID=A0A6P5WDN7_9EIME|nr:protein COP1 SUPPRESSOR 2 [Cyclospora cayetanensis]
MANRGAGTALGSSATSSPEAPSSSSSPSGTSSTPMAAADQTSCNARGLFRLGPRSLHSLRRLKELEEADATLGTLQGSEFSRAEPSDSIGSTGAATAPEDAADGGSDSDDDTFEVVRSMKDLQRMRGGPRKGLDVRAGLEEVTEENEDEEEEDAMGLLEKNFAAGGPGSGSDRHLEEFLRERMKNKEHESREERAIREHDVVDKMRDLYAIPDHLKVADKTEVYKDQMNWVTGLVEVELPMENKLKNIEATERAKRQLLRKGLLEEAEENPDDPDVVRKTAFGQRYTWYIPDYQYKKKHGPQAQKARDGHEVKQFAKRTKRMNEGRGRVGIAPM